MASASIVGIGHQRAGGRQGIIAAGSDGHDAAMFRLQHVAVAGEQQAHVLVGDQHHGLETAQIPVGAPVLGEFDAGAGELARILLELGFSRRSNSVNASAVDAGEAADDLSALGDAAHLAGIALHDGLAEAHLTVACHDDLAALSNCNNRCHRIYLCPPGGPLPRVVHRPC
jgi:hypothetical protein